MKSFLDSEFEVFWTLRLTKWLWVFGVIFLWFFIPMGLVMNPNSGTVEFLLWLPVAVVATVIWRVCLECGMAVLRIAEDLRELNQKTPASDAEK